METPKYYEFMNPSLQALWKKGGTLTNEEIVEAVAISLIHNRHATANFEMRFSLVCAPRSHFRSKPP
jgi:hypothetical protein